MTLYRFMRLDVSWILHTGSKMQVRWKCLPRDVYKFCDCVWGESSVEFWRNRLLKWLVSEEDICWQTLASLWLRLFCCVWAINWLLGFRHWSFEVGGADGGGDENESFDPSMASFAVTCDDSVSESDFVEDNWGGMQSPTWAKGRVSRIHSIKVLSSGTDFKNNMMDSKNSSWQCPNLFSTPAVNQ